MKTLAFEFSSPRRSVAVLDLASGMGRLLATAEEMGGRTTRAFELVERALREAAVEREEIERVVIGIGPGSYTGIRSTIALAQGWQLARPVRLLAVSSAECVAFEARRLGRSGRVNIVIDAQRNEFFLAAYSLDERDVRPLEPLRLAGLDELRGRLAAGECIIGPEVDQWFPGGEVLFPDAGALGELAAGRTDFVPGEKLEPIYLRATAFVKAPPPRRIE